MAQPRRVRRPHLIAAAVAGCLLSGACAPAEPLEPAAGPAGVGAGVERPSTAAVAVPEVPDQPCAVADRVRPPEEGAWFGVSIDWAEQTLAQYVERSGVDPAMAVTFADLPMSATDRTNVDAAVEQARGIGSGLVLTLEPHEGLAAVTDDVAADLATALAGYNADGVPVLVRYAHEMNGSWYPWGQDPRAYVDSFRLVAEHVHAGAPGSAMLWAPSYGGGYPFAGGAHLAEPGSVREQAADTDGDGDLDADDDGYAPYYPGDEHVDWVGISLYHWGTDYPWGENEVPQPGKFVDQLRGDYRGSDTDERVVPDFYGRYGEEHGKPVAVVETAALHAPGTGGADELAVKQAWWQQVFHSDLARDLPQLGLVGWFEWSKHEPEVDGVVDWRASGNPAVASAFAADLPGWVVTSAPTECG